MKQRNIAKMTQRNSTEIKQRSAAAGRVGPVADRLDCLTETGIVG